MTDGRGLRDAAPIHRPLRPGEELAAVLLEAADGLAGVDACRRYLVSRSANDAEAVWVTEAWTSRDEHAASLEQESTQELIRRATVALSRRPPAQRRMTSERRCRRVRASQLFAAPHLSAFIDSGFRGSPPDGRMTAGQDRAEWGRGLALADAQRNPSSATTCPQSRRLPAAFGVDASVSG
jgi:quinol monooxygenase YgiN